MTFYRRHWYDVGFLIFIALSFFMALRGDSLPRLQVFMLCNFMALLIHQFEEYVYPGGFPSIFNIAFRGEREAPERYPLNTNQVLVTNVWLAYPIYIAPIFFPNLVWLGIGVLIFSLMQLLVHGIAINVKLKSIYNPGLASTVFIWIPLSTYYFWYVSANGLAQTHDWLFGGAFALAAAVISIPLPIRLLASRTSP